MKGTTRRKPDFQGDRIWEGVNAEVCVLKNRRLARPRVALSRVSRAVVEGHRVGGQREAGKRAVEVGALCAEFVPKFVTDEREKRLAVGGVDQNRVGAVGLGGGAPRGIGAGLNEQHAFAKGCADQL